MITRTVYLDYLARSTPQDGFSATNIALSAVSAASSVLIIVAANAKSNAARPGG